MFKDDEIKRKRKIGRQSETTIHYIPGSRVTQDPKLINDLDDWICCASHCVHARTLVSTYVTITHANYMPDGLWQPLTVKKMRVV